VQVLLYMGGIGILIIFGVMLTWGMVQARQVMNSQWDLAAVIGLVTFVILMIVIVQVTQGEGAALPSLPRGDVAADSIAQLGAALVDPAQYVLPFEVASGLLAGALIGAVYIAREDEAE